MRVYVVQGGWDYEGSAILGVFSSKEEAEKIAQLARDKKVDPYGFGEGTRFDSVDIEEFVLNTIESDVI